MKGKESSLIGARIIEAMKSFIDGPNRSIEAAGELECFLDEAFPEDKEVQDLVISLASYRPEGGENLYNEAEMIQLLTTMLSYVSRLIDRFDH